MFPYKTSLTIDRTSKEALFLQLSNQFIGLIKEGKLKSGTQLIGSRSLAQLLSVHRKTVVACYEELALQGWVETIPKKGTFVTKDLPLLKTQDYATTHLNEDPLEVGFSFYNNQLPFKKGVFKDDLMSINDGISDFRLTPTLEIGRIYRKIAAKRQIYKHIGYRETQGNLELRETLVNYLNSTRGLTITVDQILITRGSQMGIWLSAQLLLKEDDCIVVGITNYASADETFLYQNARLLRIGVDEHGIITDELEKLCKDHTIKAVYVTSHHHHPTTVTLSAERRLHVLNLAKKYHFAIIEDDYDYDFNYSHSPILPLASHDTNHNVIYIGSVCKTVAPVFRIGYLIASKPFVKEASKLRGYVDRQGDALLELTFADFIKSGDLDRHIRKVLKIYEKRRDVFCELLDNELSDFFSFTKPKGGMAVWVTLHQQYTWDRVAVAAKDYKLEIGAWQRYDLANTKHNAIRIGFASYTEDEIFELIKRLKHVMTSLS